MKMPLPSLAKAYMPPVPETFDGFRILSLHSLVTSLPPASALKTHPDRSRIFRRGSDKSLELLSRTTLNRRAGAVKREIALCVNQLSEENKDF